MDRKDFENDVTYSYTEFEVTDNNPVVETDGENLSSDTEYAAADIKAKDAKMELYDWIQCIVFALVCGILIFLFVGRVVSVDGSSMYSTLHHTDRLIVSNLFYEPEQGDIVVFRADGYGDQLLVKRVIATEGQTVDIDFDKGVVYVDGEALNESYIYEPTYAMEDFSGEVTVPEDCIFVMGDNRNASTDSRSDRVGMVEERCIIGKVYMILIPGASENDPRDWGRIGMVH